MVTDWPDLQAEVAPPSAEDVLDQFRDELEAGKPWFPALLTAVANWTLPDEVIGERRYRYLVGGEAFDWLLLCERLLDANPDLVPAREREAFVFHGRAPVELAPEALRRAIGPAKYRAYLNYLYGVTVEEALQLAYEEARQKERHAHVSAAESDAFERLYGRPFTELIAEFRAERFLGETPTLSYTDLKEFTYWLFKYRLRECDPARVASDTIQGLERLRRLDALRRPSAGTIVDSALDVLDLRATVL